MDRAQGAGEVLPWAVSVAAESWAEGYLFVWHHLEDVNKHTPLMLIITLSDSAVYVHVRLWG